MKSSPSSSCAPAGPAVTAHSPSPTHPTLAFFNHSPETLNQSGPPNADHVTPRQKRKRTSKEDEEILKTEFRKNPKPDKATRMDIVSKVAMIEKEVQIWFQNRRQNERRRARPSLSSDAHPDSSSDAHFTSPASSQESAAGETQARSQLPQKDVLAASQASLPCSGNTQDSFRSISATQTESLMSISTAATALCTSQNLPSSQESFTSSVPRAGYLANRRSASFIKVAEEEKAVQSSTGISADQHRQSSGLRRTQSSIRLSMTADGQAKVVTENDQSPSPPRARPEPQDDSSRSLHRSYSAVELEDSPPSTFKYSRASIGRSRDSRAWEFWCDSDARNSLHDKAEQEGSGSAADAIGLIRANSRGALRPLSNRTNTPTASPASRAPRGIHGKSKPGMMRSLTSNGRLQSPRLKHASPALMSTEGKDPESGDFEIPNNESDKENWEPGPPRTLHGAASKAAADDRRKRQRREYPEPKTAENKAVDEDDEIASFMGAGREHASISNGEELGCVEGLLKLSRSGWR